MCEAQKYIPNHSPKLLLPVHGIDKMQIVKKNTFTESSIFRSKTKALKGIVNNFIYLKHV